MPTVPTDQNRVSPGALPTARSTVRHDPDAYGASVGQAVAGLARPVLAYAQQEQEKLDTAALMGAERDLQAWENQALFTPGTGAYAQKGAASFGLVDTVMPEYDKRFGEIESRLTDRQREVFRQRNGGKRGDLERGLMRHIGQESEVYQKNETAALVTTRLNTAALYVNDPARFDAELREAQGAFIVGNPDLPPAAQKVGLQKIESTGRRMAVEKMLRESPLAAQRYFNQYRDSFTAEDGASLEALLDPSVDQAAGEAAGKLILEGGSIAGNWAANDDTAAAINEAAQELGIDAVDLATIISYETGGTFDPDKAGPTTKWGQHRGLIQFGEPQRQKYGVRDGMTVREQMPAVVAYLRDAGVRPGMGIMDVYSAVNAGAPGRYSASDEAAGGAPGTVADKVNGQMGAHRKKAEAMFTRADGQAASPESAAAAIPQPRSYADALAVASALPPGRTRDAAINYIETQDAVAKRREAETEKAMLETINTKVEQANPATPFAQIVTPAELAWAQSTGRVAAYESRLKARVAGTDPDTPPDQILAYREVTARAFAGDKVAQRELLSYKPYDPKLTMSLADRDWLAKSQQTLREGSPADKAKAATEGEVNMVIERVTSQNLGIPDWKKAIGTKGHKDGERAWRFYNDLRSWKDQFTRDKNREPTYQEVQTRADEMTLTFTSENPTWFGMSSETVTRSIFDIPNDERDQIIADLRANGFAVTGDNVAKEYAARHRVPDAAPAQAKPAPAAPAAKPDPKPQAKAAPAKPAQEQLQDGMTALWNNTFGRIVGEAPKAKN